mgnify:CR=1 FL=1
MNPTPAANSRPTGAQAFDETIWEDSQALGSQLQVLRERLFPPEAKKELRSFSTAETAKLIGVTESYIRNLATDEAGPIPEKAHTGRRRYTLDRLVKTRPYPGIPELLDRLASDGYRMAVVSNKPDPSTREIVAAKLPKWRFARVLGGRPGVPLKPDPAAVLEVAAGLGIPPREFACLGDSGIDMETARAAGMYPVGALWGFRTADELRDHGAAALIEGPWAFPGVLRGSG